MIPLKDCMDVTSLLNEHVRQIDKILAALKLMVKGRQALLRREVDLVKYYNTLLGNEVNSLDKYLINMEKFNHAKKHKRVGTKKTRHGKG